jgi:outer membrane murein-binding lipoprotein Lpp
LRRSWPPPRTRCPHSASSTTRPCPTAVDQLQHRHHQGHHRRRSSAGEPRPNTLTKAAIANYVSDGSASSDNPIFSGNEKTIGAATEYNQIAEGDINLAMDNLHTAENTLNAQQAQLQEQQGQAEQAVQTEQNAVDQNNQEIQVQKQALAQENGEIATLVQQQQQQQHRPRSRPHKPG